MCACILHALFYKVALIAAQSKACMLAENPQIQIEQAPVSVQCCSVKVKNEGTGSYLLSLHI